MALPIQSSSFLKKPSLLHHPSLLPFPTKTRLTFRAEISSEDQEAINGGFAEEGSSVLSPPKKPNSTGLGFGSSSGKTKEKDNGGRISVSNKKKQRNRGERASIIRRSPVEKPNFLSQQGEAQTEQQSRNESAFLLTWLGLGSLILVEGIVLAGSGLLPEEWDKFLVKYLYPSFTPTVFLFVGGTATYGVLKYLQSDQKKS
ncbi:hypothetical protein HHK36_027937 [Tetracentron sinense]|uniref:Protein LOW PSII ACCUMULATION 2, chloroplastic n=1 Tax=Tetracentron sinense TaxID=13715 RepID=A0A834YHI7_TETSI|nr:hypothetical protein HHK36_027937 [Tetracentron sinense]